MYLCIRTPILESPPSMDSDMFENIPFFTFLIALISTEKYLATDFLESADNV